MFGDMLYQLYYPLLTGAFALFFLSCGGSFRRPQLWLDALTVMLSMLAVLWATLYESPLAAGADHSMGVASKLSCTIGISVTMTMTVLLFMQIRDWRTEQAMTRLIGAVLLGLFADVTWLGTNAGASAALDLGYTVGDRIFNVGEVVFCALAAGAAAAEQRQPLISQAARKPPRNQHSFWPVLGLLLAIALLIVSEATQKGLDLRILVALVLFSAVLLIVRQQGVRYELRRLNLDLAARAAEVQRIELTHLTRVSTRSEVSVSIGHEINQPLQSILSNAQAALLFLAKENPNLNEIREILGDIVLDSRRVGEIMRKLRALLNIDETSFESLDVNELVQSVSWLLHGELLSAGVAVTLKLAPDLPSIKGQRIQLQQVLLNLIINGCEAMTGVSRENRELLLSTQINADKSVVVCVTDSGPGIAPDDLERVFEAFFTTKNNGLGLGLSVSRLIISSHGGRLWAATSHIGPGASISFMLPPVLDDVDA